MYIFVCPVTGTVINHLYVSVCVRVISNGGLYSAVCVFGVCVYVFFPRLCAQSTCLSVTRLLHCKRANVPMRLLLVYPTKCVCSCAFFFCNFLFAQISIAISYTFSHSSHYFFHDQKFYLSVSCAPMRLV